MALDLYNAIFGGLYEKIPVRLCKGGEGAFAKRFETLAIRRWGSLSTTLGLTFNFLDCKLGEK